MADDPQSDDKIRRANALNMGVIIVSSLALGLLIGYRLGARQAATAKLEAPPSPPPPTAPPIPAPPPSPPPAPPVAAPAPAAPIVDAEARRPPAPESPAPHQQILYGVIYDLADARAVPGLRLHFEAKTGGAKLSAQTDEHGWYKLSFPQGAFAGGATVGIEPPSKYLSLVHERNPPLRETSPGYRRAVYEGTTCAKVPTRFELGAHIPAAELDLAADPPQWPDGMPPAESFTAEAPTRPDAPKPPACIVYGMVYDFATKAAFRCYHLSTETNPNNIVTDDLGRYSFLSSSLQLAREKIRGEPQPGYRPALIGDDDATFFGLSEAERRSDAEEREITSEPVSLAYKCADGVQRLDLIAVPEPWPKKRQN